MTWFGRRVLVTGHTGFKGAWLVLMLQRLGADVAGLALRPEHANGAYCRLAPWPGVDDAHLDIRDADAVARRVADVQPEIVIHLGAQALVRRSYREPRTTYEVNVLGTSNVLEAVRSLGSARAVLVVTSDKVYRQSGNGRPFREDDPLGGDDPYSASKACAEMVVQEFARRTPGLRVATARAGNVVGGGDRGEDRLVPDLVRAAESGVPARLRCPDATRPWQHVLDAVAGYVKLAELLLGEGTYPRALNFGPRADALPVGALADLFVDRLGAGEWVVDAADHPHEQPALALDPSRAEMALGWAPRLTIEESIAWTAEWYAAELAHGDLRALSQRQLEQHDLRSACS